MNIRLMVKLTRTVRFCINPGSGPDSPIQPSPDGTNGFGGKPAMRGLGRYYELTLIVRGEPDPITGYLINIKELDRIAREHLIPLIEACCHDAPTTEPAVLMPALLRQGRAALPILTGLRWALTPTYSVEGRTSDMSSAIIRQQFDFAAAHRLHCPGLSDEENRNTFGRCNNPSGHGHNYRVEAAFGVETQAANPVTVGEIERLVDEAVINRFDHKHLNEDTEEFASEGGVNPSVENIAEVFYRRLTAASEAAFNGKCKVHEVTVWETDRTSATYPAHIRA
ncbi:MAG: 6-pyruvoyl trahydropterin synthase family protein [Phycisphaerales bacterium JB065]